MELFFRTLGILSPGPRERNQQQPLFRAHVNKPVGLLRPIPLSPYPPRIAPPLINSLPPWFRRIPSGHVRRRRNPALFAGLTPCVATRRESKGRKHRMGKKSPTPECRSSICRNETKVIRCLGKQLLLYLYFFYSVSKFLYLISPFLPFFCWVSTLFYTDLFSFGVRLFLVRGGKQSPSAPTSTEVPSTHPGCQRPARQPVT